MNETQPHAKNTNTIKRCQQGECLRKILAHVIQEEMQLAVNAWHLARYVQEHQGKVIEYKDTTFSIAFPADFDGGAFMQQAKNYVSLNDKERIQFMNAYGQLEKATGIITARTLSATQRVEGLGDYRKFPASRHFLDLLLVAIGSSALACYLLQVNSEIEGSAQIYFAFTTASLGASVYLLRITQLHLKLRSFEVERIPSHYIRLVLGIIAGGSLALFPELISDDNIMGFGVGVVAFVMGYGVDIYYDGLEALKNAMRNTLKRITG